MTHATAPADTAEPSNGFRPLCRRVPPVWQGKTKMVCDGFCNHALVFKTKVLVFANPKLGLESLDDPNLISSKEC